MEILSENVSDKWGEVYNSHRGMDFTSQMISLKIKPETNSQTLTTQNFRSSSLTSLKGSPPDLTSTNGKVATRSGCKCHDPTRLIPVLNRGEKKGRR